MLLPRNPVLGGLLCLLGARIMGVIVDNMVTVDITGNVDITGTVDIMGKVDTTGSGPGENHLRPPPGLVVDITGSGPLAFSCSVA